MILVDSSVWIDHWNQRNTPQVRLLREAVFDEGLIVADLVMMEVLQGFRTPRESRLAHEVFLSFDIVTIGGAEQATRSAQNYQYLRQRGFTIRSSIDCLIATYCIDQRIPLLHTDRDFAPFAEHLGLEIVPA